MKNVQILLYYCFNKIIKVTGTSFQSTALNKRHVSKLVFDQIPF